MLPRGAQMRRTPPRYRSTSSAPSAPYWVPENDGQQSARLQFAIHNDIDIGREEFGRGTTAFWRRCCGRAARVHAVILAALLAVEPHRIDGKQSSCFFPGYDVEEAHHRMGYATAAIAVGGD